MSSLDPSPGPVTAGLDEPPVVAAGEPPSPSDPPPAATDGNGRAMLRLVRDVLETLVLTAVIFFVVQTFVAQPFQVQQISMQQTFQSGEYVLVDKLTPRWDAFDRGDVIVFEPPDEWTIERTPFIKRVIGVGGDEIELREGVVYVNGAPLQESYTYRDDAGVVEVTEAESTETRWRIPEGSLFVMGDHRRASLDSRAFGPIPVDHVVGRVSLRYWPLSTFGILPTPTY